MTIYQFKITLLGIHPPIWRRFRVNNDISLEDLHNIIQIVMGWGNYHLYQFGIGYESYGGVGHIDGHSARQSTLIDLMQRVGYRFSYEYDFGDQWLHELELEKILTRTKKPLPICTGGNRACPPEDIGGVWGYEDMVKGMKQGRGRRYNEWRQRLGERFNPEAFDIDTVNEMLAEWRERNEPIQEAIREQPHALPIEQIHCQMCGRPTEVKPRAGKTKLYCSAACKQAAYRQSKGVQVSNRRQGNALGNVQVQHDGIPICALEECDKPAERGKRNRLYKMYCSDSHKQKAKRQRRLDGLKSNAKCTQALPSESDLIYLRKGKGVIHISVQRNVTFCGRDAEEMEEVGNDEGYKVCQRCQRTRDDKTWWQGWRDAFEDTR